MIGNCETPFGEPETLCSLVTLTLVNFFFVTRKTYGRNKRGSSRVKDENGGNKSILGIDFSLSRRD